MEYIITFLPTQDTNGRTDMTAHNHFCLPGCSTDITAQASGDPCHKTGFSTDVEHGPSTLWQVEGMVSLLCP